MQFFLRSSLTKLCARDFVAGQSSTAGAAHGNSWDEVISVETEGSAAIGASVSARHSLPGGGEGKFS
jgi:hypothetical protein